MPWVEDAVFSHRERPREEGSHISMWILDLQPFNGGISPFMTKPKAS